MDVTAVLDRVRRELAANDEAVVIVLPSERSRLLNQAAIEKQIKNANAAKGTISALDPSDDPHLAEIIENLDELHSIVVNARQYHHQTGGTPLLDGVGPKPSPNGGGAAPDGIPGGEPAQDDQPDKKKRGKRGGAPSRIGDILPVGSIIWADYVPQPRPEAGQPLRTPGGYQSSIVNALGYREEMGGFEIIDSDGWQGFVYWHEPTNEWRLAPMRDEYPVDVVAQVEERTDNAAPGEPAGTFIVDIPGTQPAIETDLTGHATETPAEYESDALGPSDTDQDDVASAFADDALADALQASREQVQQANVDESDREHIATQQQKSGGKKRLQHKPATKKTAQKKRGGKR